MIFIIELDSGRLSLEFPCSATDRVMDALSREYGNISRKAFAAAYDIKVSGERFVMDDEWGNCCIISTSSRGDGMLRRVLQIVAPD